MKFIKKWPVCLLLCLLVLSGCATVPQDQVTAEDPWQSYNRAVFKFNAGLDRTVLKPAAKGYRWVMPGFAEKGVSNFFANLGDISNSFNNLLQGKIKAAGSDSLRFLLNSTFGIGGLFDHASDVGLVKHEEDFGQTLAVWGVPSGPYMMVPVLGPNTVRDSSSFLVDQALYPLNYLEDDTTRMSLLALRIVNTRYTVLKVEESTGINAYDDYAQMRDVYLQRRKHLISDGQGDADIDEENELRRELEMLEQ